MRCELRMIMRKKPKKLPDVDPAWVRQKVQESKSEAEIQTEIVQALRALKFEVLITNSGANSVAIGAMRAKGMKGGAVFASKGIPDLLVRKVTMNRGSWLALEVKSAKGKLRPEQELLYQLGGSWVVRSLQDVLVILAGQGLVPTTLITQPNEHNQPTSTSAD